MSAGFRIIIACGIAVLALSGCGKRGALEAPSSESTASGASKTADAPQPHKPFVLDSLLR